MLAQNNQDIQEAVVTVYQLTQEEKIRQQCEAREDYYRRQNDVKRYIQRQENTIQQQAEQIQQLTKQIQQQAEQIQMLTATINVLQKKIAELQKQ